MGSCTVRTTATQQHNIPLPLVLMSRPRRSRVKGLAVVAGIAMLALAAMSYTPAQHPQTAVAVVGR